MPRRTNNSGWRDVWAVSFLFVFAALVGFFYHGNNWVVFCDILWAHIDTHLYYSPLASWGNASSGVADIPTAYALFQMPKGYLFFNLILFQVVPLFVQTKIVPVVASLVALYYFYRLMRCYADGTAAFFASFVFCLHAWTFHVYQALCPRAFFYPLLLAFLYYFQKKRYFLCGAVYGAQCLFYPQAAAISLGVVVVIMVWRILSSPQRVQGLVRVIAIAAAGVLVAIVLHYMQYDQAQEREFGPVISYAQMKVSPEFHEGGKESFFFKSNEWWQWLMSKRAGIGLNAPLGVLAVFSLLLWGMTWRYKEKQALPLIFKAVAVSSVVAFLLAYACLFVLYYPARYVMFTAPLVLAALFGVSVSNVFKQYGFFGRSKVVFILLLCVIAAGYGAYLKESRYDPNRGGSVSYHYLKNIIAYFQRNKSSGCVAANPHISDPIPLYTGNRVLFSDRTLIPFQTGYYGPIQKRLVDFYEAYYAVSLDVVKRFCRQYQVDYLVVDRADFKSGQTGVDRKYNSPYAGYAPLGRDFTACVLPAVVGEARVYEDGDFIIIDGRKL